MRPDISLRRVVGVFPRYKSLSELGAGAFVQGSGQGTVFD